MIQEKNSLKLYHKFMVNMMLVHQTELCCNLFSRGQCILYTRMQTWLCHLSIRWLPQRSGIKIRIAYERLSSFWDNAYLVSLMLHDIASMWGHNYAKFWCSHINNIRPVTCGYFIMIKKTEIRTSGYCIATCVYRGR